MDFLIDNLEIIVTIAGGVTIAGIMYLKNTGSGENDLTQIYIRYKKHTDNINKSSKSMF